MKVLVLGCGPAGLLSAHAASMLGHDVRIISNREKSFIYGAQYLHERIPMLGLPEPQEVRYELRGTHQDYRRKVYGEGWRGTVSPEDLAETHLAWDIRAGYNRLWDLYGSYVIPLELEAENVEYDLKQAGADTVFTTVPMNRLCQNTLDHQFYSQTVWALGDAPDMDQECPVRMPLNSIVCNGESEPGWYRAANVFGHCTAEWSRRPPLPAVAKVQKPLDTNCDCLPGVVRLGRYGRWQKGILAHQAFTMTVKALEQRQGMLF